MSTSFTYVKMNVTILDNNFLETLKDLNQKQTSSKTLFPYVNEINIKLPESKSEMKEYAFSSHPFTIYFSYL